MVLERGVLWRKVIKGKFGKELGGLISWVETEGYGVVLWKSIRNEQGSFG